MVAAVADEIRSTAPAHAAAIRRSGVGRLPWLLDFSLGIAVEGSVQWRIGRVQSKHVVGFCSGFGESRFGYVQIDAFRM